MIPKECKRLAEMDFPIAVVSKHSAREKSIRHRHPSTLHLWWATNCGSPPTLQEPIKDPDRSAWNEVRKVHHYWLNVASITQAS